MNIKKNNKHKDKTVTTIPDLGQRHERCDWVTSLVGTNPTREYLYYNKCT